MSFGEYCSEPVKVCDKEASHALQIFSPSNEQNLSTIDMLNLISTIPLVSLVV